jgi:cytochrome oxidase assembly protein ShyY1
MYRKKLTYSLFTIPFAFVSFNVYDWQLRRFIEKKRETQIRVDRVSEKAENIQKFYNSQNYQKFPWIGLNVRDFNSSFAYKPIELNGQFDHSKQVFVQKVKEGEEGFDVITPFYCYRDENGEIQPVLVNRGWIPYDSKENYLYLANSIGQISIKGLVYKGEEINKYSKENDIKAQNWNHLHPEEIATVMYLPNKHISSKFVVKQIEFNPVNKSSLPVVLNISDLARFPISEESNANYATFWKVATFFNIFSNLFVWVYL